MAKTRLCLLDEDGDDKRERLITVTGSVSTMFHEALDIALDINSPAEQQQEIAKIVALESFAQDFQIISQLADKNNNGYILKNVENLSTDVGSDEIVVDVHNTEAPDAAQLSHGMDILGMVERGQIGAEQYIPVLVYPSQQAVKSSNVMAGFESLCAKAGVKVCHLVKKN
jgi:hypothetical protein